MPTKKRLPTSKPNQSSEIGRYLSAAGVSTILFTLMFAYVSYRSGSADLSSANKVFADTSALLLGMVLIISTGSRLYSFPDKFMPLRKHLGIIAFFLGALHSVISFLFLPQRFPIDRFLTGTNWPFNYGASALALLLVIFLISNRSAMNMLGSQLWWKMQYWGLRLSFILIVLHVYIMKWSRWLDWYRQGGSNNLSHPELPDLGLLMGWSMLAVILIRVSELMGERVAKVVWNVCLVGLAIIYAFTFLWGAQFTK